MFMLRNCHTSRNVFNVRTFFIFRKLFSVIRNDSVVTSDVSEDHEDSSEEPMRLSEQEILQKRNKSRLTIAHRNILHNKIPYPEPCFEYHNQVRFKRKMYGLYGNDSGIDPSICWPTPNDILSTKEYESLSRPHTFQEMVKINSEQKAAERERVLKREEEVAKNFAQLDKWKQELAARIQKKEVEAAAAKAKRDRLIEEVRRHFGFKVDARDERFKEMLEKKEKDEKKLAKEAKKKAREVKLLSGFSATSEKPGVQKPI